MADTRRTFRQYSYNPARGALSTPYSLRPLSAAGTAMPFPVEYVVLHRCRHRNGRGSADPDLVVDLVVDLPGWIWLDLGRSCLSVRKVANVVYSLWNFVPVWIWPWPRLVLAADPPLDPAGRSGSRLTCGKCEGICPGGIVPGSAKVQPGSTSRALPRARKSRKLKLKKATQVVALRTVGSGSVNFWSVAGELPGWAR